MSSMSSVSATVSPQIQAANTGKTGSSHKQEGQAATQSAKSADQTAHATSSSGPQATGNNIDTTI